MLYKLECTMKSIMMDKFLTLIVLFNTIILALDGSTNDINIIDLLS